MSVLNHNDDIQEELINEFNTLESKFFILEAQVNRLEKTMNGITTALKKLAAEKGIVLTTTSNGEEGSETCTIN